MRVALIGAILLSGAAQSQKYSPTPRKRPSSSEAEGLFAGASTDFYARQRVPALGGDQRIEEVADHKYQPVGFEGLRELKIA